MKFLAFIGALTLVAGIIGLALFPFQILSIDLPWRIWINPNQIALLAIGCFGFSALDLGLRTAATEQEDVMIVYQEPLKQTQ
jgi:hypothetical protein